MRPGACSAAYPALSPETLLREAKKADFAGIEWRVATRDADRDRPAHHRTNNHATLAPTLDDMAWLRRRSADLGLAVIGLSPYVPVGDTGGARRALDLATVAGTDRVRMWAPATGQQPYHRSLDDFRRFLDRLAPDAAARGVRLAVEVHHGTICPSASLTARAVEGLDPAAVGVIYDVGNLAVEGYEDPRIALDLLGAHLCHVQLKNARIDPADDDGFRWSWCPLGEGVLPLPRIVGQLRERGYAGWLCCEDFSRADDPADETADEIRKLRTNRNLLHAMTREATACVSA